MNEESANDHDPTQHIRPKLAAKTRLQIDALTGKPMLLYPEGVVMLNETGAAIMRLCDGTRTLADIVATLAQRYAVSTEVLQQEVHEYLLSLHKRSIIEFLA